MKRDFLESLNIDREAVDAIMAESGRGVEKLKERIAELEGMITSIEDLKKENADLVSEKDNALDEAKRLCEKLCRAEKKHISERLGFMGIKDGLSEYITDCIFSGMSESEELDIDRAVSDFSEKYPQLFDVERRSDGGQCPSFSKSIENVVSSEASFASRFEYLKRS